MSQHCEPVGQNGAISVAVRRSCRSHSSTGSPVMRWIAVLTVEKVAEATGEPLDLPPDPDGR